MATTKSFVSARLDFFAPLSKVGADENVNGYSVSSCVAAGSLPCGTLSIVLGRQSVC